MERTIVWENTVKWVRAEITKLIEEVEALQDAAAKRAMDNAVRVFHAAKELAKEKGPDSDVAKAVEVMERAWRESYPRMKKRGAKGKKGEGNRAVTPNEGTEGAEGG
jgi:hypothetical protein